MLLLFLIIFLIVIAGLAVLWASRLPGSVEISFGEASGIEAVNVEMVYAILAIVLLGAVMALAWGALTGLIRFPGRFARSRRASKAREANKALAEGLLAAEAGDAKLARKLMGKAEPHADDDRLKLLLEARIAEITDDWAGAERAWSQLSRLPGGQLAGLRGAAGSAHQRGDRLVAEKRAREALELKTHADWPFNSLFESQVARGEWAAAIETLSLGEKRKLIAKERASRRRAVLLTANAADLAQSDRKEAQKLLADALRADPAFPPAAWYGARQFMIDDKVKGAQSIIETGWRARPHPALSLLSKRLNPDDSWTEQSKRMNSLVEISPDHRESRILRAELAMGDERWDEAIKILALLVEERTTARLCLLLEQALRGYGDNQDADRWARMAVTASREPEWSDIDPRGIAFDYSERDWGRLVYAYGDVGDLVHPRYEAFDRELEVGRVIALPSPTGAVSPAHGLSASTVDAPEDPKALPPQSAREDDREDETKS